MCIYDPKLGNLLTAKAFFDAGLNVIPIRADGTKSPCIKHKPYHSDRYPWYKCKVWFASLGRPHAIGILCGAGSGNLEVIDFDLGRRLHSRRGLPKWARNIRRYCRLCQSYRRQRAGGMSTTAVQRSKGTRSWPRTSSSKR